MNRHAMKYLPGSSGGQTHLMRSALFVLTLMGVSYLPIIDASAAGTPAGTTISNFATITYNDAVGTYTRNSTISTFVVDDRVSFTLTSTDAANSTITASGRAYMTYILANSGNAPHDFTLSSAVSGSPTLTPASGPLFYADAAGTIPLPTDPNAGGLPYISSLAPDTSITVYLFITAPAAVADGQSINYVVAAEAWQSGNLGAVNPPVRSSIRAAADAAIIKSVAPLTTYVVLADGFGNGGDANRDGLYATIATDGSGTPIGFLVQSATLTTIKSVTVTDPNGTVLPVPGATLHYTLSITATGSGTALGTVITDPVPANTTYVAGTLRLNGTLLSDTLDGDDGDVGFTVPGSLTINLGDLTSASPVQTITFDVKIN
jgi:uncharacterized repeat protein (TIGR01451 family)